MSENKKTLEELIQNTMADDLPNDLEERMHDQMGEFFEQQSEDAGLQLPDFTFLAPVFDWFARPAISYAFTAVMFVCLIGASMLPHITGQRNALATAIDAIHLTTKVFAAIENAETMVIQRQVIEGNAGTASNIIQWSSGVSRIDFGGDRFADEVWMIRGGRTEIHHPGKQSTVIEAEHETAALFATPERITNQLMGKWKVSDVNTEETSDVIHIRIENMREGYQIEIWVDTRTYLPVHIESQAAELPGGGAIFWDRIEMDLVWNQPVDIEDIKK